MKKLVFLSLSISALLFASCGNTEESKSSGKIRLAFKPISGKEIKINYQFSVNQVESGDLTAFEME